jgi:hypothetical protein
MTPLRVVLRMFIPHLNSDRVLDLVPFEYSIYGPCKKCGDISYLTSETLGNLTDFGYKS